MTNSKRIINRLRREYGQTGKARERDEILLEIEVILILTEWAKKEAEG